MAANFVSGVTAYAGEKELGVRHCITSGYKCGSCCLTKKIARARWVNRDKLSRVLPFERGLQLSTINSLAMVSQRVGNCGRLGID
jgi:hypothetical protein